jgi:hypothetical protein
MTSPPTIAGRVAAMQATRAATPPDEVTAAFSREQAELAAGGSHHFVRRHRRR